jgi:hypothetical protein
MRGVGLDDERSLSACLFGNRYRLELLAALAEAPDGRVNLGVLAEERGVSAAVYYPPMRDLLALRMVTRVEQVTRDRRRWYQRSGGDRLWESMARLIAGLQGHFEETAGVDAGPRAGRERVGA